MLLNKMMWPRIVIFMVGVILTAAIVVLGLILFPNQKSDFWMNITSEVAGVFAGGLVLFVLVELYLDFRKGREWNKVQDELYDRIYWEIEVLQFTIGPTASWGVGWTIGEELRMRIETGPDGPLEAKYFIKMVDALRVPLDYLNTTVTPRIVALADDSELTHCLLDLEEAGVKLRVATHSLSESSPDSFHQTELINGLLNRAAVVGDCIDKRRFYDDQQKAAQARFDRLFEFRLSGSWSSDRRKMKLPNGSIYNEPST